MIRDALDGTSELVARFERLEPSREQLGDELAKLRADIESHLLKLLTIKKEPK